MNTVYIKSYDAPIVDRQEILRYMRISRPLPELESMMEECLLEIKDKLVYQVCYGEFPITFHNNLLDLTFSTTQSSALCKHLLGCNSIFLLGATIGLEIDRLIARYSSLSPSKALFLQAIGAERIEALCDTFQNDLNTELSKAGKQTVSRFSPGYGDLPLEMQSQIFAVLDCSKKIGLTLNQSLLMSPTKSVTAIIGVKETAKDGSQQE